LAIDDLRVGFGSDTEPDKEEDDDRRQNGAAWVDRGEAQGDLVRETLTFATK